MAEIKSETIFQEAGRKHGKVGAELVEIYEEMRSRNAKNVLDNGFRFDTSLNEAADNRRCLAAFSMCDDSNSQWTNDFHELMKKLRDLCGNQVYYGTSREDTPLAGRIHWTYMQIVGFNDYDQATSTAHAAAAMQASLKGSLPKFTLNYFGAIAVPTGVLLVGFPSSSDQEVDVNLSRHHFRRVLTTEQLPYHEPYLNDIVHSTLVRFANPLEDASKAQALLSLLEEYNGKHLGTFQVESISVGSASWRMHDAERKSFFTTTLASVPVVKQNLVTPLAELPLLSRSQIVTHRGLEPDQGSSYFSEQSYEALIDQLARGFSIEFDPAPTKDSSFVCIHDSSLSRITENKDNRSVSELTETELTSIQLTNGRVPSLHEVLKAIGASNGRYNAMHVKGNRQEPEHLKALAEVLKANSNVLTKMFLFDLRPESAKYLKAQVPGIQLAASVAHLHDKKRYNSCVNNTLLTVEELLQHADTYTWAWLDEWDLTSEEEGVSKQFLTAETFGTLRKAGFNIGLVTPELHSRSPGLLGGEAHPDAANHHRLMARIKDVLSLKPDCLCTDFPEQVYALAI